MSREPRSFHRRAVLLLVSVLLAGVSGARGEAEPPVDPERIQALEYRLIGPFRGGRVTAVTGVRGERDTFYMGSTGGGVWKSTDAGRSWRNISDEHFESGAIGAVAVAPSDPNVIYAGTGSACIRGNVSPGVGLYRSTDAGKSWAHVGLADAGQIGRIRVHPENPDVVYVAALGHAFGSNEKRGVFRSKDGGGSWEKVLYVSDRGRRRGPCAGPVQPAHPLRGDLAGGAPALDDDQRRRRRAGSTARWTAATPGRN